MLEEEQPVPTESSNPRNRRKHVVWCSVAGAVVIALGIVAVQGEWIPGPKPSFPEGSGVRTYADQDSLPPQYESGFAVTAGPITRHWTYFHVHVEGGNGAIGKLRVGETTTLAGVTITLCDTWVNKWAYLSLSTESGGSVTNASRVYYVQSTDGSIPKCP